MSYFYKMSRTGIVIVHWNNTDLVYKMSQEIDSWDEDSFECIVVDNSDDYPDDQNKAHLTILRPGANSGFAGGCNIGIEKSLELGCDQILLLNADVVVALEDINTLKEFLNSDPELAAVAPVLREEHNGVMSYHKGGLNPMKSSNTRAAMATLGEKPGKIFYLPGTVLLIKSRAIKDIGPLDTEYFFSGEVADWFFRLHATHWKFALCENVVVDHLSEGNEAHRGRNYIYYSLRNRYLMISKYGDSESRSLRRKWTNQLRRQLVGAYLRLDIAGAQVVFDAMDDGLKGRFGKSRKY